MAGGPPEKQEITNKLDKRAERFRNEGYDRALEISKNPYSAYEGERVAGPTLEMDQARDNMAQMGGNFMQLGRTAQGMQFGSGVNPNMQFGSGVQPGRQFGQDLSAYDQAGNTGARALGGDQSATDALMNPYQRQVIDAMGGEYDRMRGKALMSGNDMATRGGAFGGSRHALMQGERLGAIDRSQAEQTANLLYGGFNDAMGRAGSAAQLGLGAGGQRLQGQGMGADFDLGVGAQRLQGQGMQSQHQLGVGQQQLAGQGLRLNALGQAVEAGRNASAAYGQDFNIGNMYRGMSQDQINSEIAKFNEKRDWDLRGLNILTSTAAGSPYGTTQSQPLNKNSTNAALGGASAGFSVGGPPGAVIGAGLGYALNEWG